jgi:putative hydrolase of the HAD superfamily
MLRAILFDMGGTLDGGGHWLDRFAALYADAGLGASRERVRAAFDEAERRALGDEAIAACGLDAMVQRHVTWQLEHLGIGAQVQTAPVMPVMIAQRFVTAVRRAAVDNVRMLADLSGRGLKLGVVSNGCGNVDVLCTDLGYAPYLSAIVDSRRVGLYKPDPAIFVLAAARLGVPAAAIMMVGDSFDRDVRPARSAGMMTGWLAGAGAGECPDRSLVDVRLARLSELPAFVESGASIAGAPRS